MLSRPKQKPRWGREGQYSSALCLFSYLQPTPDSAWEQDKQSSPYSFLKKEKRNSPNSTIHFIVEESVLFGRLYFLPETWNQEESNSISFSLDPQFLKFLYCLVFLLFRNQIAIFFLYFLPGTLHQAYESSFFTLHNTMLTKFVNLNFILKLCILIHVFVCFLNQ